VAAFSYESRLHLRCLSLARNGLSARVWQCPLSRKDRKSSAYVQTDAIDPERASDFGQGEIGYAQILAGRRFAKC
jgi:hypothetical protein